MKIYVYGIVIFICLVVMGCLPVLALNYQINDLGVLPSDIHVNGMSSTGYILGWGNGQAVTYTPSNGITYLAGFGSQGFAGNEARQVVGQLRTSSGQYHAFHYTPGYGVVDLGTLGGSTSGAKAINNVGQVTGFAYPSDPSAIHAFVWTPGIGMTDIGTLGGNTSGGYGINDQGQVTGDSECAYGPGEYYGAHHAFLYTPGLGMIDIGTLGGSTSVGRAINNKGQVAGDSSLNNSIWENAFLYTPGVGIIDLGALGQRGSSACAINNVSQVVGSSYVDDSPHAFVYTPGYGMMDLGTLGGFTSYSYALAVNDDGVVFGLAYVGNAPEEGSLEGTGSMHMVLWEPVPEPSSVLATLAGLAGLGGIAWRRNKCKY